MSIVLYLSASIIDKLDDHTSKFDVIFRKAVSNANLKERVTLIGTSSEAFEYIERDAARATTVLNTYLAVRDQSSQKTDDIKRVYKAFFSNNRAQCWHDLVGLPDLFNKRYDTLDIPEEENGYIQIKLLRHSAPIVNFIQFEINGKTKTYFGWVGFNKSENKIYVTEDSELNELFTSHYNRMFEAYQWHGGDGIITINQGNVREYIKSQTKIVDKLGCWLTVERKKSGDSSQSFVVESFGLLLIEYDENNRIRVTPTIFDANYNPKPQTKHIDAVKNFQNKLYFDFSYKLDEDTNFTGMCSYDFSEGANGEGDTLSGHLHRYKDWEISKLSGFRIDRNTYDRLKTDPKKISEYIGNVKSI